MSRASAILEEPRPGIARLWLGAPRLSEELCGSVLPMLESLRTNDELRVLLVGSGKPGRPASWPLPPREPDPGTLTALRATVHALASLPMPVLAALSGAVEGEALELALACDLRLASADAAFAMPQLLQGRLPCCGGTQRLPRLVGLSAAWGLFLGQRWDSERALALGLVGAVVPAPEPMPESERIAAEIAARAPIALRTLKDTMRRGLDVPLDQALLIEEDAYLLLQTTEDRKEGIRAFLAKRKPKFEGR